MSGEKKKSWRFIVEKPGCAYFGKILHDFIVLFKNHEESWSCSILPAQAVSCRHDNKHMLLGRRMQLGLELIHLLRQGWEARER